MIVKGLSASVILGRTHNALTCGFRVALVECVRDLGTHSMWIFSASGKETILGRTRMWLQPGERFFTVECVPSASQCVPDALNPHPPSRVPASPHYPPLLGGVGGGRTRGGLLIMKEEDLESRSRTGPCQRPGADAGVGFASLAPLCRPAALARVPR